MLSDKIFYYSITSFLLGIVNFYLFAEKQIFLSEIIFYILLILLILVSILIYLKHSEIEISKNYLVFLFFILFFILGFGRSFIFEQNNVGEFDYLVGKKIETEMIIDEEVEQRSYKQKIIAKFPNSDSRVII